MTDTRVEIDTVYVDCEDDEVLLVRKVDALLDLIQRNKERLVVILCSEGQSIVKIRRNQ